MTRSAGQRDLACQGGEDGEEKGLKNIEILSPPFISSKRSRKVTRVASAKSVTDLMGGKPGFGGSVQAGISMRAQGSARSITFSTMMKTH